ncbi:MAG: hypothetical protein EBR82_76180 [Caulobacteraceae bacterium]|nr:hypothetical protein [Caulobacteraceae bacterium]
MNHYTLRFPDEPNAEATADRLGYLDDDGEIKSLGHDGALDIIGEVTIPGTYDEHGDELSPPAPLSGFYVNLALPTALPRTLAPFKVPYGSGGRIFAGTEPEPGAWPPTALNP